MAWTFVGYTSTPLWLSMKPSNFPRLAPKMHLLGLSLNLYLTRRLNNFPQIYQMISRSAQLGDHVIHIDFDLLMHHIMEQGYHGSLVSHTCIFQTEWHDIIGVSSPMGSECHLGFVLFSHRDLIITRESIHKGEEHVGSCVVN